MRLGSAVLCNGSKAPQNSPSCRSCCPLSRTELSVQRVIAEEGSAGETMRAVTISWRSVLVGLVDKEMLGEEVVSETASCALPEIDFRLVDDQQAD